MPIPSSRRTPNRPHRQVWAAYLHSQTKLYRLLERELQEAHGISMAEYDVLAQLIVSPERRIRIKELAGRILYSTGGLSRLLDRMEISGYVQRVRTPEDRRGVFAAITDEGITTIRAAGRTHLAGVQRHFAAKLHDDEFDAVKAFLDRLMEDSEDDIQQAQALGNGTSAARDRIR